MTNPSQIRTGGPDPTPPEKKPALPLAANGAPVTSALVRTTPLQELAHPSIAITKEDLDLERRQVAVQNIQEKLARWLSGFGTLIGEARETHVSHGGVFTPALGEQGPGSHTELRLSLLARIEVPQPLLSIFGIVQPRGPIEARLTSPIIVAGGVMNSEFEVSVTHGPKSHQHETFNADLHKNAPEELRSLERALPYFRGITLGAFIGSRDGDLLLVSEKWRGSPHGKSFCSPDIRGRELSPRGILDEILLYSGSRHDRESSLSETITRKVGLPKEYAEKVPHAYQTKDGSVEIQFSCHPGGRPELIAQIHPEHATVTLLDQRKPKTPPLLCFVGKGPEEAAIFTKALLEGYRIGRNRPRQ